MNKHKVTLSESNPPRIGNEFEDVLCGKVTIDKVLPDCFGFINPSGRRVFVDNWLGLVVTRTEEEDGA